MMRGDEMPILAGLRRSQQFVDFEVLENRQHTLGDGVEHEIEIHRRILRRQLDQFD